MEESKPGYRNLSKAKKIIKKAQSKGIIVDLDYLAELMAREFDAQERIHARREIIEKMTPEQSEEQKAALNEYAESVIARHTRTPASEAFLETMKGGFPDDKADEEG